MTFGCELNGDITTTTSVEPLWDLIGHRCIMGAADAMSNRRKTTIVLGLFLAPLFVWYFVLNNVAVYRSISLAPGTVTTQDFHLNYSGYYRMGIQAERKLPHGQVEGSLGLEKVEDTPALRYSWTLSCDGGKMTLSGSSEKIVGGAYARDWVETQFGGFEGKHWERCQLKIHFLGGGEGLSGANPKLRVYIELF